MFGNGVLVALSGKRFGRKRLRVDYRQKKLEVLSSTFDCIHTNSTILILVIIS